MESLYTSQRAVYNRYDFKEAKEFLQGLSNTEWPFMTSQKEFKKFVSIPRFNEKVKLSRKHMELKFLEVDSSTLLFKFKFGAISMVINLVNRNLSWLNKVLTDDPLAMLYPEHFRAKLKNYLDKL